MAFLSSRFFNASVRVGFFLVAVHAVGCCLHLLNVTCAIVACLVVGQLLCCRYLVYQCQFFCCRRILYFHVLCRACNRRLPPQLPASISIAACHNHRHHRLRHFFAIAGCHLLMNTQLHLSAAPPLANISPFIMIIIISYLMATNNASSSLLPSVDGSLAPSDVLLSLPSTCHHNLTSLGQAIRRLSDAVVASKY